MDIKLCSAGKCMYNALIRRVGDEFPQALDQALFKAFAKEEDKAGCRVLRAVMDGEIREVLLLSVDRDAKTRAWQKALNGLYKEIKALEWKDCDFFLSGEYTEGEAVQIIKTLMLADYRFDRFKSSGYSNKLKKDHEEFRVGTWTFCSEHKWPDEVVKEAEIIAESVSAARDLVNLPANHLTPSDLAEFAEKSGREYGFEVDVFGPKEILEKKLHAFWAVGKASEQEPRFIVMRFHNNPDSKEILALVGKGLTYDSGGYAIKTTEGMRSMQTDMGGSAAVINAVSALARAKAKVNVTAIVAACENMISGGAYHNGDIISSLAGKSIEIMSTDAEGRLTLADAVTYAWQEEKASAIIDIATLTGAVGVALGENVSAIVTDSDRLLECTRQASYRCGDNVWQLPMDDEYEALNKSDRADIKNSGGRPGATISAGLFIRAFANATPWLHLDIASTAWHGSANDREPAGASGVGCELLYFTAKNFFA